nr:MAG TPA: hypothetical protein [Caudoviricetes sp.]
MGRESFVFYRSFYEGINELPRDIQGEVLTAIMEYGLNGVTTENQKPITKAMFALIKPQLDANNQRFENGKNGGAPKGNQNARKQPKNNQETTEKQPKNNQKQPNVNVNDNVNDNDDKDASAITDEKKYYSSDNGVIKSISELKRDYLNDENLCNAIIKNLKIVDKNMLSERLGAFNQHLELQGERLKEVRDYRTHFKNWLKKRQEVAKNTPVTTAPKRIRFDENGNEITY